MSEQEKIRTSKWRLEEIFSFFDQQTAVHNYVIARQAVKHSAEAISLIQNFPSRGNKIIESAKESSIKSIQKAQENANEYQDSWDYKESKSTDFTPSYFLNPGYNGVQHFLEVIKETAF